MCFNDFFLEAARRLIDLTDACAATEGKRRMEVVDWAMRDAFAPFEDPGQLDWKSSDLKGDSGASEFETQF